MLHSKHFFEIIIFCVSSGKIIDISFFFIISRRARFCTYIFIGIAYDIFEGKGQYPRIKESNKDKNNKRGLSLNNFTSITR